MSAWIRFSRVARSALLAGAIVAATTAVSTTAMAEEAPAPPLAVAESDLGLIEDPVPLESSPVEDVSADSSEIVLGEEDSQLVFDVDDVDEFSQDGGIFVAEGNSGEHSVSVIPLADGVQIVVDIASADAPTEYALDVSNVDDVVASLTAAGEVELTNTSGEDLGIVAAPWAYDAQGVEVPTRFAVNGNTIVQVVDHQGGDFTYPITADPKWKNCNYYTATCVTFSKSETKKIANASVGAAGVAAFCGLLPNVIGKVACGAVVAPIYASMRRTFEDAARTGKCVEVKFNRIPPAINAVIGWKKVSC